VDIFDGTMKHYIFTALCPGKKGRFMPDFVDEPEIHTIRLSIVESIGMKVFL
jgi:hypothetical protein